MLQPQARRLKKEEPRGRPQLHTLSPSAEARGLGTGTQAAHQEGVGGTSCCLQTAATLAMNLQDQEPKKDWLGLPLEKKIFFLKESRLVYHFLLECSAPPPASQGEPTVTNLPVSIAEVKTGLLHSRESQGLCKSHQNVERSMQTSE